MKRFLLLICVAALYMAGCTTEGDKIYNTYNITPDSTGLVMITNPTPGDTVVALFNWVECNHPSYYCQCPWGFTLDTTFTATVIASVPGEIQDAQVYMQQYSYGSFAPFGPVLHPASDTFNIDFCSATSSFNYSSYHQDIRGNFYVQVSTSRGANIVSRTIPFVLTYDYAVPSHAAPAAPAADTLFESPYGSLYVQWCAMSPRIDDFIVCRRAAGAAQIEADTFPNQNWQYSVQDYLPLANYSVWIKASNEYGVSPASDTLRLTTLPPVVPAELGAWVHAGGIVELQWQNRSRGFDSVLVARRDTLSAFSTLCSLPRGEEYNPPTYYTDSTAVAHMVYFYKVGVVYPTGTWWTTDSVGVWIP
ncbi:MAG TPA: hypothetical protein VGL38_11850 [bacterium]|jgi:hypothetical protein